MDRVRPTMGDVLSDLPLPARHAAVGAVVAGVTGGSVGLVLGLLSYAPTAWAAVLEVGAPATLLGAAFGMVSGSIVGRRRSHRG